MKRYMYEYKMILADYGKVFLRNWWMLFWMIVVAVIDLFCSRDVLRAGNFWGGIPVFFALAGGCCHGVSLSPMMYQLPASRQQRELYIQRMLYVKIAVPVGIAVVCNVIAGFVQPLSLYAIVIQLLEVIAISGICGAFYDGTSSGNQKKAAFASLHGMEPVYIMICFISGFVVFAICMGEVSTIEFGIVVGVLLLCHLPASVAFKKHWKTVRSNFANYETAVKLEDVSCRW